MLLWPVLTPAPLGALADTRLQSALHATGVEAQTVERIWWIMLAGGVLVMLLVTAILFYTLFRRHERRATIQPGTFILAGGVVLPTVTLTALLIYTLQASSELRGGENEPVDIEIVGHRWWWEVRYVGSDPQQHFKTANELHLPVGVPTRIRLWTQDVIHSFWVPNLAGKIDLLPGTYNELVLQPTEPGISRGQCAEFCGAQHTRMALYVIAQPARDFAAWRERQLAPASRPENELANRGREVFLSSACAYCHTIRGTTAAGTIAPDLTHVGSRRSLAAGTFDMNRGNLAGWIVHAQQLKPESLMPSFTTLGGPELRALTAYLESLE